MILSSIAEAPAHDIKRFAWNGLRKFLHTPSVTKQIIEIHQLERKHRNNAVKQALQIRQCLIQASEYASSAKSVSFATRPVLLYYSLMSLALAQILFKGSGMDSLDKARGSNAHHGLVAAVRDIANDDWGIEENATALIARPMIRDNARLGTFELWCKYSREDPIAGKLTTFVGGMSTYETRALFTAEDRRFCFLPEQGISLYDCLCGLPGLHRSQNLQSRIIRGHTERTIMETIVTDTVLAHPHPIPGWISKWSEGMIFHPSAINRMEIGEISDTFHLSITSHKGYRDFRAFPPGTTWDEENLLFAPPDIQLNEFGYLYVTLFILGNYARYHPDKWVADVENGTPLALAAEEALDVAEGRMALITLSELSRLYFVPRART